MQKPKTTEKWFSLLLLFGMLFSLIQPTAALAQDPEPPASVTVDPTVLQEINANGSASYWVEFGSEARLSYAKQMNWEERGWYVYNQLTEQANRAQRSVVNYLKRSGVKYQSYWINNTILVQSSNLSTLNGLTSFAEIEAIKPRKSYILYEPDRSAAVTDNQIMAVEPNLTHINVDDAWALGYTGEGLVVANIDTGVRYSHEALVDQYRGNAGGTFDHNYNWFDPDNLVGVPYDGHGHGTHTMGTIVGDDGGSNQIGVAPGADWIACAGCPNGSCTDTALLGCAQWIAAPTDTNGNNPDPSLRPNVVNNSWGDCGTSYDPWYQAVVNAWHSAGIYPVFSNGNSSNCGYASPPGLNTVGNPARYGNVTGVGSSGEQNGLYASHSNWGPTDNLDTVNPVPGYANMKPQVIAPGVNIRSSTPGSDTDYQDGWTGTSMSAPHVTGLTALIWQAAPCLIGDYAATETLIEETAIPVIYDDGSPDTATNDPNYAAGWGEIDALAAVQAAAAMCGDSILDGTVTDAGTSDPIQGAKVELSGAGDRTVYTNADGYYNVNVFPGVYDIEVSKFGYDPASASGIVAVSSATTTTNFQLTSLPAAMLTGVVYDGGVEGSAAHGYPLYASLTFSAPGFNQTIYSDPFSGDYAIELYLGQEYDVTVQAIPSGYGTYTGTFSPDTDPDTQDFSLYVLAVSCAAPGYVLEGEFFEGFESSALPAGWVNYDYLGNTQVWLFNDPEGRGNLTPGGEGGFAILDSDYYGTAGSQNAGLRTPELDLSSAAVVSLEFDTNFNVWRTESAVVRVSNDNGVSWTTRWSQTADFNGHVTIDLTAEAAGQSQVIIEFLYQGVYGWWWQIDDVFISTADCNLIPGGVVAGYTYDGNTSAPLTGATVTSDTGAVTVTIANPDDPLEGFYWLFQPTVTDPEEVTFTASLTDYADEIVNVTVVSDAVTQQDFYLGAGDLVFDPLALEKTMTLGDAPVTEILTINNTGTADAAFELLEHERGFTPLHIPAFTGDLPASSVPSSIGRAPGTTPAQSSSAGLYNDLLAGEPAFAVNLIVDTLYSIPDTTAPGIWNEIGVTADTLYSGDFSGDDFTTLYVINSSNNILYGVDTTSGAATAIGPATPPTGETFTGLTGTPYGELYGLSTTCSSSSLVMVDPASGATTVLGALPGISCGIDLAYNTREDMIYIVDINDDSLFRVDPFSLEISSVGSVGIDASYAQGMDYEEETGILYWAAYSITAGGELRVIDMTTGASALVGAFSGGADVDSFAFATGGVSDVPWLSEDPVIGAVPAGGSTSITVTFDPVSLLQPGEYEAQLRILHDTPYGYPTIPVSLHLLRPANWGTFNGTVSGMERCDVNPAALEGATVNFYDSEGGLAGTMTTTSSGYYSMSLEEGTYDIEVIADGYASQMHNNLSIGGGETVTFDIDLRLNQACLSVDPTSLDQILLQDTSASQTLTLINSGAGEATFEFTEINAALHRLPDSASTGKIPSYQYAPELDLNGADNSKRAPGRLSQTNTSPNQPADILVNEGFEDAFFPPTGWTQVVTNATKTWTQTAAVAHSGSYGAYVPWDYNQDEWLLTQELALASGTLSVWSQGSIYWCRDTYDNCDLNVWLVVDAVGGGDDVFVANLDEDWPGNWIWTQATFDLASILPGVPVRIGFQYIGDDDADTVIDDIVLDGVEVLDVPWLSEDIVMGTVPADSSLDVTVTFDATGLALGDYSANLRVKNLPDPSINIPTTLHVVDNLPPVASNQAVTTAEDTPVGITLGASDADGDNLTWTIVDGPDHGALGGSAPNLTYTPANDYNGADSFTFKVSDGEFDSNVATVALTVTPLNDAPVAVGDAYAVDEDAVLTVGAGTGVLANDSDSEGDPLTAVLVDDVLNGTLALAADGSFVYTADADFSGSDSFTYQAFDGEAFSDTVTVVITVGDQSSGKLIFLPLLLHH